MKTEIDTIAAIATPSGQGGVGIVRVSGPQASTVAQTLLKKSLKPRVATFLDFYDESNAVLDQGIAILFKGPHSFTGEDVLELQGHGGPVVLDLLLSAVLKILSVRLAKPGEFSERAFLNDKIDLVQAEAIADLISATTTKAARSAMASLQGVFSKEIHGLLDQLTHLRMYVEAAIDFPEEEIDFLSDGKVKAMSEKLEAHFQTVIKNANQGALLKEGMNIVIAGKPNAGKSSLLNALSGRDAAIVTHIAGTTRDVLREHIDLDGLPLHIIDTAGLRDSDDPVEQEGVKRAWHEIEKADVVLLLVDGTAVQASNPQDIWPEFVAKLPEKSKLVLVRNKIDLTQEAPGFHDGALHVSLTQALGLEAFKQYLKDLVGFTTEGKFMARRRHLDALHKAHNSVKIGLEQLAEHKAGELLAEDLRQAQLSLAEITGEFSSDDLLGKIFSSFCIGK